MALVIIALISGSSKSLFIWLVILCSNSWIKFGVKQILIIIQFPKMSVLNSPFFPDNHVFWILLAEYLLNLFPPLSFYHHSHYLSHDYWKCSEASGLVHFRPFSILPWNYTSVIQIHHLTLPLIMAQWFQTTYKFNFLNFPVGSSWSGPV